MKTENFEDASDSSLLQQYAQTLRKAGYVVLDKFVPQDVYASRGENDQVEVGVVLDTETTGKDVKVDRVIELGMVFFEYNPLTGQVLGVTGTYNELQDPGMPIAPEASAVNGITDDMVAGKVIDAAEVERLVANVSIVIAHNSKFDRAMCEREWPFFANLPWACSFKQVDWAQEQLSTAKLEFIAFKRGFCFEAHRAEIDCRALLHVLQAPLGQTGQSTLKNLLDKCFIPEFRIWAANSPFDMKDVLKARGYFWDPGTDNGEKAWYIDVTEEQFFDELDWIRSDVFKGRVTKVVVATIDAYSRFSGRLDGKRYMPTNEGLDAA